MLGTPGILPSSLGGAAWLSSARAVRCRLKCHNERNPHPRLPSGNAGHSGDTAIVRCEEGGDDVKHNERNPHPRLPSGNAGHSGDTAIVRCEEGGDDVKSARPLRPGLHTGFNGRYRGQPPREWELILKAVLSSDWSLQPDST